MEQPADPMSTRPTGVGATNEGYVSMETDVKEIRAAVDKLERNQTELMVQLAKKRGLSIAFKGGDENAERGNWTGKLDFFLSCLGCAVGLGNVWRFPYLCYKNGGGAFLIPFLAFLVFSGTPIFMMELSLGQFTSCGPLRCWEFAPGLRGMGVSMVLVSALVAIYYNVLMAWSIWYLFASFTSVLPWSYCGSWSSQVCSSRLSTVNSSCNHLPDVYIDNQTGINGTCWLEKNGTRSLFGIYDVELANSVNYTARSESIEFLNYVSLQDKLGSISNLGPLRWDMSLCLALAWIVVCLSLIKGIKSSGKVVYFTALFPYVVMFILLVRGLTLPGASEGVWFLLRPQMHKLREATVWKDAAVQIFYSLSTGGGGLITLASYNRFRTDVVRDTMAVVVSDFFTSILSGVVVFSFLGFLANETGIDLDKVVDSGVSLAFIVYPQVVTKLPVSPLWAILFFLMLVTLGLDSQFTMVETLITAVQDQWPQARKYKALLIISASTVMFLIGLSMCTPGGPELLTIFDDYSGSWNVMALSVLECLAVAWIYGARRFANDIGVMTGPLVCGCVPWRLTKWWWILCWGLISPAFLAVIMVYSWVDFAPSQYAGRELPAWSQAVGWLMTSSVLIIGAIVSARVVWRLRRTPRLLLRPTAFWGPALPQFRQAVAAEGYAKDFCVDPPTTIDKAATNASIDKSSAAGTVRPAIVPQLYETMVYPL
ncbi:hypothetical protein BOX15_Mlig005956g4 [Macrostomum lignano]|uniref:Transporter n=2 Tax=Macrostomum lignano TaxID=282301 RepID=A0A1I8JI96_9PLAT|nr:hypothetical protein BOX15_Mlig005956g4 [Macrostomum lignano]